MDGPIRPGSHRNRQWQFTLWRKPQEQQTSFRTELNDYCILMVSYQLMIMYTCKIGTIQLYLCFLLAVLVQYKIIAYYIFIKKPSHISSPEFGCSFDKNQK